MPTYYYFCITLSFCLICLLYSKVKLMNHMVWIHAEKNILWSLLCYNFLSMSKIYEVYVHNLKLCMTSASFSFQCYTTKMKARSEPVTFPKLSLCVGYSSQIITLAQRSPHIIVFHVTKHFLRLQTHWSATVPTK